MPRAAMLTAAAWAWSSSVRNRAARKDLVGLPHPPAKACRMALSSGCDRPAGGGCGAAAAAPEAVTSSEHATTSSTLPALAQQRHDARRSAAMLCFGWRSGLRVVLQSCQPSQHSWVCRGACKFQVHQRHVASR
jgi:hypothetical protein